MNHLGKMSLAHEFLQKNGRRTRLPEITELT